MQYTPVDHFASPAWIGSEFLKPWSVGLDAVGQKRTMSLYLPKPKVLSELLKLA